MYILCFYYAMTTLTTVGYGDIGGENTAERIYCAFLQIFGTVVFATIMNQLSMVLDNINFHAQEKEHRLTKCRRFLKKHFIDEKLSRRILDWTTFQYDNDVAWHENKEIMDLLPRSMRSALALELHERMLSTIPIFFRSGSEFIAEVALRLIPERYNSGERVASCGQLIDRMYVVFNGVCVMVAPDGRHISAFTAGDYLGELNVIREQIQKTNLICADFSELWCLEKEALDHILPRYPLIRRVMVQIAYDSQHFGEILGEEEKGSGQHCGRRVRGKVAGGLLRGLSVQSSTDGRHLPSSLLAEEVDDPVCILRWSFMVTRSLRRLYSLDISVRIQNRITSFGSRVFFSENDDKEECDSDETADEEHSDFLFKGESPHVPVFGHMDHPGRMQGYVPGSPSALPWDGARGGGGGAAGGGHLEAISERARDQPRPPDLVCGCAVVEVVEEGFADI